ncbi:MAG: penicillin acylase family protein [Deltaproteobacteria bacterium]
MSEEGFRRLGQAEPPAATDKETPSGEDRRRGFGAGGWSPPSRVEDSPARPSGFGTSFGGGPQTYPDPVAPAATPAEPEKKKKRRRKTDKPDHPRYTVAALSGAVKIKHDKLGVPHIDAKREHDAWAALGFCAAQDRLWQLDLVRRIATGRMAEILGIGWARHDAIVRTAGIARRAEAAARRVGGTAHEMLVAYAGGVNGARAHAQPPEALALDYEVQPWTVADSLAVELYWAWSLSREVWPRKLLSSALVAKAGNEVARATSPLDLSALLVADERRASWAKLDTRLAEGLAPPEEVFAGLVSGFATPGEAGGATLAATLQGAPGAPCAAWAAHLEAPGFSIAGLVLPGTPIFITGRNAHIAWAGSGLVVDDVDIVMEELDGIGNFRGAEGRERLARRHELIRVRDGEDLRVEVVETRNGPLFSELMRQLDGPAAEAGPELAIRWGANSLRSSVAGWLALGHAKNVEEARAAASALGAGPVSLELAVCDAKGATASVLAGSVPDRTERSDLAVRGWHKEAQWRRLRPLFGEAKAPVAVVGGGRPSAQPDFAFGEGPDRRERLDLLLADEESVPTHAALLVQGDLADSGALALARALALSLGPDAPDAALLTQWDGAAVPDSRAAALFWVLVVGFLPEAIFPEVTFGSFAQDWRRAYAALRGRELATDEERAAVGAALVSARAWLAAELGEDPMQWTWERACSSSREHRLAAQEGFESGRLPERTVLGSLGAVAGLRLAQAPLPLRVASEAAARLVCDPATKTLGLVLASGIAGAPSAVHFADQAGLFADGQLHEFTVGKPGDGVFTELVP